MQNFTTSRKLIINSKLENIRELDPFLKDCCKHLRLNSTTYNDMLLALTEAVTNSIRHGNNCNPNKIVEINVSFEGSKLHFKVLDEGCGFNHQQVPDPTAPHRMCEPNGRGLFLMRQLSNNVRYADNGRCVEMTFRV